MRTAQHTELHRITVDIWSTGAPTAESGGPRAS